MRIIHSMTTSGYVTNKLSFEESHAETMRAAQHAGSAYMEQTTSFRWLLNTKYLKLPW